MSFVQLLVICGAALPGLARGQEQARHSGMVLADDDDRRPVVHESRLELARLLLAGFGSWPGTGMRAGDAALAAVTEQAHEAVSIGELEGAWPGRAGGFQAAVPRNADPAGSPRSGARLSGVLSKADRGG